MTTGIAELVARVEVQGEIVDRELFGPARWRGPTRRERRGRPLPEERARLGDAYNWIARTPETALTVTGLLDLHDLAVGGAHYRTDRVRVGRPDSPSVPCADPRSLPDLVAGALARASSGAERAPLAAARVHLELATIHPFADGNGRVARLVAGAVLLADGHRSTLIAAVEQAFLVDPRGYRGAFERLATDGDVDAWITYCLAATVRQSDAVARFRRREHEMRNALTTLGIDPADHALVLLAFDTEDPLPGHWRAASDALLEITAPWPRLAPAWGTLAQRLEGQLRRLRAEELDDTQWSTPRRPGVALRADSPVDEPVDKPVDRPVASVVVPAYRAADTIVAVLEGLAAQNLAEPFEVIVVASGGDATADIVRRAFPSVMLLATDGRLSPGAGRNAGVAVARGSVVAFLAADCVPDPDWLRLRVWAHRAGHALVGGFVDAAVPSTRAGWAQYFAKFGGMQHLDGIRREARGPIFHLSYERSVLDAPFDEDTIAGEDTVYNHRLVDSGYRVWFDSAIRVRHVNSRRWGDVLAGQREQGAATGAASRLHELGMYYVPSVRGGPWRPLVQSTKTLIAVARFRRALLARCVAAFPLTTVAIATRRRAFRRTYFGRTAAPDLGPKTVVERITPIAGGARRVTALVPAYNEEAAIADCLDSLLAQTLEGLEIIVIDDGSTDRTADIARSRGVRLVAVPHGGPATAKNAGARVATGEVLVFVDADLIVERDCVERLSGPILSGAAIGTFTTDITVANPENGWADCWTLNRRAPRGQHFPAPMPSRWENFRAVARAPFLAVGGYDDVGYGEDMTLAPKLGALADIVGGARMQHRHPDSLREIRENARWVGRGTRIRELPHVSRRYAPWRSVRRGINGARRLGRPRYLLFAVAYDWAVLTSYWRARLGHSTHAK